MLVIREINDHSSGLNKWKAYNSIGHDMRASGNKDAGGLACAGEVQEVKLKTHSQLGVNRLSTTLNNTQEDDQGVNIGNLELGKAMQTLFCNGRNKVEVASGEGGCSIPESAKDQIVCGVGVAAKLELDVREVHVNQHRKDIARRHSCGQDQNINHEDDRVLGGRSRARGGRGDCRTHVGLT